MPKRTADIYIRVSTTQQAKGYGLQRQKECCYQWCTENGFQVRDMISDTISAFRGENLERGNLSKALDQWRKGYWEKKGEPLEDHECPSEVEPKAPPNYLIVEDFDRLTRINRMEAELFLAILRSIGVKIIIARNNQLIDVFNKNMVIPWKSHSLIE